MGRNFSFFTEPSEFIAVVERACLREGLALWLFPEGDALGTVERIGTFDDAGDRGLVWVGRPAEVRPKWTAREASIDAGFACTVRPRLIGESDQRQLLLGEIFANKTTVPVQQRAFDTLKRELTHVMRGKVGAQSDHLRGSQSQVTGIRFSAAALDLYNQGVVLRQVSNGKVHFVPLDPTSATQH